MNSESHDLPAPARPTSVSALPVAEFLDEGGRYVIGPPKRRVLRRRVGLSIALFGVTAVSVFACGTYLGVGLLYPATALLGYGLIPVPDAQMLREGAVFTGCVLAILLAHEMGHFLQAIRHGVPATLPFFIPFPINPFGTMGAVIVQDGRRANRRQLFDIAVSGPLAGLLVAIPVLIYGIATSHLGTISAPTPGHPWVIYGDPPLIRWIVEAIHGPYGPGQDVNLNAPLFAGWVGIFITALNLLPIGQLDGGHLLYTLIGRPAHYVAFAVLGAAAGWMAWAQRLDYLVIVLLLLLMGFRHPPTADDRVPLGPWRILIGWVTLAFVLIGFTPTPVVELIPFVPPAGR